jgi:hypothetical protein
MSCIPGSRDQYYKTFYGSNEQCQTAGVKQSCRCFEAQLKFVNFLFISKKCILKVIVKTEKYNCGEV